MINFEHIGAFAELYGPGKDDEWATGLEKPSAALGHPHKFV